jgi:glycosyltransferase involved in cell wall biosynthesis
VRVHIVDPSAYTPPYDHALCAALAAAGAQVELYTSRFAYGPVPAAQGYERHELFYRAARLAHGDRRRRLLKLIEHVPDMVAYRRAAGAADVVHFQWLTVQHLDGHLLPGRRSGDGARRPLLLTAHDILPREPRRGQREAQRRLYGHFDAIVVHSRHGRARLVDELGVDPALVHVIPHGALVPPAPAAKELPFPPTDRPVVLFFGLLRPYKGLDLLLEAWRGIEDAALWVAGMPRFDISALRAGAPANVHFQTRFLEDSELSGLFARADLIVLPYREIDQSGVAFTALGAGLPMLLSDAGGFPELAGTGAARTVPAGDAAALGRALRELLADPKELERMAARARQAAAGEYSWARIAALTLDLYRSLSSSGLGEDQAR